MLYTKDELQSLPRKELQRICKQFQIKANKKNRELVADLDNFFSQLQVEAQNTDVTEFQLAFSELVWYVNKHHGLSVAHININGIFAKRNQIKLLLVETKLDILAV